MDKSASAENRDRRGFGWRRAHGWHHLLFHAGIFAGRLSAGSARRLLPRNSREPARIGLPLLPQRRGEIVVFKRAVAFDMHELSQPGFEGQPQARARPRERVERQADSMDSNS